MSSILTENKMPELLDFSVNAKKIKENPLNFYYESFKEKGDYVRVKVFPGMYMYMVFHPDGVQHILKDNQSNYKKTPIIVNNVKVLFGKGLFTNEGESWLKQRRLIQPAFHRKKIEQLVEQMAKAVEVTIEDWNKLPDNSEINISEEMTKLTIRILSTSLFSIDISSSSNVLGKALRDGFEYVNYKMNNMVSLPLWFPNERNKKTKKAILDIDNVINEIISSRINDKQEHNDLLDILLKARDEETNIGMTTQQLKDELLTMLAAGHDTTSAGLSWTFYLLAQNKDKKQKLFEEVDSIVNDTLTVDKLNNLEYTKMCFEEGLRLYPPAWGLARESINSDIIGGYEIKPKTLIALSQYTTHKHPDFWEKPYDFYPEHFESDKVKNRHPFAYFPFGGGSRVCIGMLFAMMESQIILSMLTKHFDFELVPNQDIIPDPTFTLIPKQGIKFIIKKRRKNG